MLQSFRTYLLAALFAAAAPAHAQLAVTLHEVDFTGLPRITFKACVERNGMLVRGLDASHFTLMENGIPRQVVMRCPDPTGINSVIEVLDNSGSMFAVLPKLVEAAGRLVDSLGTNDEAAILSFGRTITLNQDFTTDRTLLKNALGTLSALGGTPLFDASYEAVTRLGQRAGNRRAVIITDGEDNLSVHTVDEVIALAQSVRAKLYTIAFSIAYMNQEPMRRMAQETGGSFFIVERPSELTAVYERIAAEITEPCCIAEYVSSGCADSLRSLLLTVSDSGQTAVDQKVFPSPSRPLSATLSIEAPESLTPLMSGMAYVSMTPAPDAALELSLSFTVRYDDNLVDVVPPLPFTLGTVAQNQVVTMNKVAPGALRFQFKRIRPAVPTTRLVGFPLQALVGDSSRLVDFSITDVDLEGCPVTFTFLPDTTSICQCRRATEAVFDAPSVLAEGGRARVSLRVRSAIAPGLPLVARARLTLPADARVTGVTPGSLIPAAALAWQMNDAGVLAITVDPATPAADTAGVLAWVHVAMPIAADVTAMRVRCDSVAVWQQCCPDPSPVAETLVLEDGYCERVLGRTGTPGVTVAPNPVTAGTPAHVRVFIPGPDAPSGVLTLLDAQGRPVRDLATGTLAPGIHTIDLDTRVLPSGAYHVRLTTAHGGAAAGVIVLR